MMTHKDSCPLPLLHPVPQFPITSARNRLFLSVQLGNGSGLLQWDKYLRLRTETIHCRTMPSIEKILYFLSSAGLSIIGVAVLSYGMSAEWASSIMACSPKINNGTFESNGTATIRMGLFKGSEVKVSCPFFSPGGQNFIGKLMMFVKISM